MDILKIYNASLVVADVVGTWRAWRNPKLSHREWFEVSAFRVRHIGVTRCVYAQR